MERQRFKVQGCSTPLDLKVSLKGFFLLGMVSVVGYIVSIHNQLLFHIGLDSFSTVVAFCIFMIAVISGRIYKEYEFLIFGLAFMFIGIMGFLHMLAHPGMGVFESSDGCELSCQLSAAAGFIESASLMAASLLLGSRRPVRGFFAVGSAVLVLLLLSIFKWHLLPACCMGGNDFTIFKRACSCTSALLYILIVLIVYIRRDKLYHMDQLSHGVVHNLMLFFSISAASQISFTLCMEFYDMPHVLGSVLRAVSYYFVYNALAKSSIMMPCRAAADMNNKLEQSISMMKDMAEALASEKNKRERLESEVSESEQRYRTFAEFLPDAVIVSNVNRVIYANKAAERLVGAKSRAEVLGKDRMDFVHPDYRDTVSCRMEKCRMAGGVAPLIQQKFVRLDGSYIDVETTGACLFFKGEKLYVSVTRDISERMRAERLQHDVEENRRLLDEAARYDRFKNEFMANISHELRTPLNIVFSDIQLLECCIKQKNTNGYDEDISRHIRMMRQNGYRLLKLVNNIIDISRMDSGFYELQLKYCDIINVIEDTTMSAVGYAQNKGISMVFDTDVEEAMTCCDPEKIERVMLNLLSNAVKFTAEGGNIWVSVYQHDDCIEVSVKDNGVGIPEDKLAAVFNRYVQVDSAESRSSEGSGIGLSLAKSIIEAHNGKISVYSREGKGSEFIFSLPIVKEPECSEAQPVTRYDSGGNAERLRIEFSDV